ncbi:hypothetical protein A3K34_04395 [candidate division WWE3 bacterium RIFOXYC1_FULL_40_10]|uniref:Uncharacterized protein n=1 Tax=candidate division WWE3 bacterium RIFOXYA2_FULL_46_9 TaxID=1802636 RepID=A0A1F4W0Z6_UNCKA|nr:MAG: hypothetical protein A3K58_04395 [candidate division WWE3 bacterium RIFOXYB1_FULL_40_22]OGC62082.1 MAG: hypothetical protein A3K37_04395 [candidate division WWE3 bacterium RIFOXYA1_FULL_40_11]OGC63097.1 MAG: hypothetical protein A2264_00140 [candidate division WWE3 bacterium RIFOXYA2_FULL_46_9]OGC64973.1 MAG: hypothetical protein A2326_02970 [candidate division WWE3 bacterium RIFOXYB2_FULL_41_6]OGC66465.1 MAG: hypothetical protein A3K34_04395 [candidate division WWE3 bacterium RIFOXYC1_
MTLIDVITNIATPGGFVTFIELIIVLVMGLYVLYSFIVLRQVDLMNKSLMTPEGSLFKLLGWFHFVSALIILFLGIMAL